jgi:mRNA interferase RelE/StbE
VADYALRWSRQGGKELDRLPQKIAERVYECVDGLGNIPRPQGVLKLKGGSGIWRLRLGDYRVLDMIDDSLKLISILSVQHRKDAYRDL